MITDNLIDRITTNPDILVGKPIIRGMRISVEQILKLLQLQTEITIKIIYAVLFITFKSLIPFNIQQK